jgi:hypothetical protein
MTTKKLQKKRMYDVFHKHIDLERLRLKANDIERYDILTKNNQSATRPIAMQSSQQGTMIEETESGIRFEDTEKILNQLKMKVGLE